MKIGVSTWCLQKQGILEKTIFEKLAKIGYNAVDFGVSDGWKKPLDIFSDDRAVWLGYYKNVKKIADGCGIDINQTHATFPVDYITQGEFTDVGLVQFEKEIEASAALGAKYIVIHPINLALYDNRKAENLEINRGIYSRFIPSLKEHGMYLAVENMFSWDSEKSKIAPTGCSFSEDILKYMEVMQSDRFVACLDVGHVNLIGEPAHNAVKNLKDKLKILHVHDNYGISDDHNIPTMGTTDWKALVFALKEIKYDGVFSMEIDGIVRNQYVELDLIWENVEYAYAVAKKIIGYAG